MIKRSWEKVIAIDGPSGSGKSTVAQLLAHKLGFLYVDTGAMFRALGLYFEEKGWSLEVEDDHLAATRLAGLQLTYGSATSPLHLISINGQNYTQLIRQHYVSDLASRISKLPSVRQFLLDFQRVLVQQNVGVMEGRDIGTVVFPHAFCKIFLTASFQVRAERRQEQLLTMAQAQGASMQKVPALAEILEDMKKRDERDQKRDLAPRVAAEDAWNFDTSDFKIEEVVAQLVDYVHQRAREVGLKI